MALLAQGPLGHRPAVDRDQLVDQPRCGGAAAGDDRCADAVGVHRSGGKRGDGELVQVAGDHDPGGRRAEAVEQLAHLDGERRQVAGVEAHCTEVRAGDVDGGADARVDVEGVHEQRRLPAQGLDLRGERRALVVVQEREGVCSGARGGHAVPLARGQVGRGREAGDVRRARRSDGGLLVGPAGAHLEAGSASRGGRHA